MGAGILTPIHPHHNTPTTAMLSQPQGHPGPNQQDTEHLQGQPSPSCLVTPSAPSLPFSLYSLQFLAQTHTHTHTHTYRHFLSCFLHPCPCVIIDSFSLTAPHPSNACHSSPQAIGDYSRPYPPRLQQHNFTQHHNKE